MIPPELEQALQYEADIAFSRRVRTIFEWLDFQDTDRVLDCGCGRGFYLNFVRHASNCHLVGIDLELEYLEIAQKTVQSFERVDLAATSIYDLPFPDNCFDKVIFSEVLEHLRDDRAGLQEIRRVMRPGGIIAITVPNANYPFIWDPINKILEKYFHTHISDGPLAGIWANHVRLYTPDQLRAVVQSSGLEIEEMRAFTHYAFPFTHNLVYGLGKPLIEAGLLPEKIAQTADRAHLGASNAFFDPVKWGLKVFYTIDRLNKMNEPPGRSTVNLCLKARKPMA